MKSETLQGLITARLLFKQAESLCEVEDRYVVSAGLVILQDALELVFYAALLELGVDEKKSLENLAFNDLMGTLRSEGHKVAKSGTLKALNNTRLTVKHYAQLAEPATVRNYLSASRVAINGLLEDVVGKRLDQILLIDILEPGPLRDHIFSAAEAERQKDYFAALVSVRKAIFEAIEEEYVIDVWKNADLEDPKTGIFAAFRRRGSKAPWHTKNQQFIEQSVSDPFAYVQIDHRRLTLDLTEMGIGTQDFWNLWRLTPAVFRYESSDNWLVKGKAAHFTNATAENAQYCIDKAVSILASMQSYRQAARWLDHRDNRQIRVRLKEAHFLYLKADLTSRKVHELRDGDVVVAASYLQGFDCRWYYLITEVRPGGDVLFGYVPAIACDIVEEDEGA
ncbi:MAG: hypothetical protein HYZ50_22285 [Deltaproteobacteria bacterium]|nr:hypothetical protein [Deltaproteobacteria bacterium]